MLGVYFSGTGNTKYCMEKFLKEYDGENKIISIENENVVNEIEKSREFVFAYPIQYSNLPKIVREFIEKNSRVFKDKKIFIIATMALFSGDGTGCSERLLKKCGAKIIGGIHLKMPDNIGDVKILKKTDDEERELIEKTNIKIKRVVKEIKNGKEVKEGLGRVSHVMGLLGQRLWFYNKTLKYRDDLKIDREKCVGCGICARECPMKNIKIEDVKAKGKDRCTMCYRCISHCPKKAITLIGKRVYRQNNIEKYSLN